MSRLDDILGTPELYRQHPEKPANKKRQMQKNLLKELINELIGEDEHKDTVKYGEFTMYGVAELTRNELRAELRKEVEKL